MLISNGIFKYVKYFGFSNRIIQAEITIGQFKGLKLYVKMHKIFKILWIILWIKGKKVFIPRMPLIPSDTGLPFDFMGYNSQLDQHIALQSIKRKVKH